jgi:hypothetical protein
LIADKAENAFAFLLKIKNTIGIVVSCGNIVGIKQQARFLFRAQSLQYSSSAAPST